MKKILFLLCFLLMIICGCGNEQSNNSISKEITGKICISKLSNKKSIVINFCSNLAGNWITILDSNNQKTLLSEKEFNAAFVIIDSTK